MYEIQQLKDSQIIELTAGSKASKRRKKQLIRWIRRWRRRCRSDASGNDRQKVTVRNNGKGNHVLVKNHVGYHEVW